MFFFLQIDHIFYGIKLYPQFVRNFLQEVQELTWTISPHDRRVEDDIFSPEVTTRNEGAADICW